MAMPKIRVRCAGVRSNQRDSLPVDTESLFFSESHYASSPYFVRVTYNSVSFLHRGTHVVERRFMFPGRVLHAVLADFSPQMLHGTTPQSNGWQKSGRARKAPIESQLHPHLCILVRSDYLNVYTAAGEVFEVALPFQANRLFPVNGQGLLLQRSPAVSIPSSSKQTQNAAAVALASKSRRASTSNRGDGERYKYSTGDNLELVRPRYFTLRHPLDEVKPVALSAVTVNGDEKYLSDSALEAVDVLEDAVSLMLVTFHRWEQRFCVYRLNAVQKVTKDLKPEIKLVDGPTWTRYQAKCDLEEPRVWIKADWVATMLWKTSPVGPVNTTSMYLSPISSTSSLLPTSPVTEGTKMALPSLENASKAAFFASSIDNFPLLCLMDKDTRTLLLKPIIELDKGTAEPNEDDSDSSSVRILQCRDAVPIQQYDFSRNDDNTNFESSTDIVVLELDGTLTLYRAHYPICHLLLSDVEQSVISTGAVDEDDSTKLRLAANVQLNAIGRGSDYEILYPKQCGNTSGKIVRCEHPLKVLSCPRLEQVYNVLACIVPPKDFCVLKAHVVSLAQRKAQDSRQADDLTDGGLEWQAFSETILSMLPKQSIDKSQIRAAKTNCKDAKMAASLSSFDLLCRSEFHDLYQYEHAMLFATMELPVTDFSRQCHRGTRMKDNQMNDRLSCMNVSPEVIFTGLHMLCEDLKLSKTLFQDRVHLAKLLLTMAVRLKLDPFILYYQEDNCVFQSRIILEEIFFEKGRLQKTEKKGLLCFSAYGCVPDLLLWLQSKMTAPSDNLADFSTLFDSVIQFSGCSFRQSGCPLRRTKSICRVFELLSPSLNEESSQVQTTHSNAYKLIVYLTQDPIGSTLSVDDLPVGLSFPIVQIYRQLKHHPPPLITEDICKILGREDLSIMSAERLPDIYSSTDREHSRYATRKAGKFGTHLDSESYNDWDGLEGLIRRSQPTFPTDQRMKEVARLLRSSRPLCLRLEKTPDSSDLDYAQQQQARLLLLCKRSMALSVARGMVTLGSLEGVSAQTQAWRLQIPALPLQGRKPPTNAIVELDLSGYAKELTYWPQFHNGCATGLRLPTHDLSGVINRHWIKYHRPSVNDAAQRSSVGGVGGQQETATQANGTSGRNLEEAYAAHAGLLLGIGLRGHLKCLSMADVYNYLSLSNEFVTVAIMLGMASSAAHCRRKQRQQTTAATTDPSDEQIYTPQAANEGDEDEITFLEDNHFYTGFSELSSVDVTPLLGTGLELALERSVSKMLCLHVPSLLPPPFGEFSVPASTQTAALVGLGILYQGTGYRLMTELLLTEIARSPSSAQFVGSIGNAGTSTPSFDQLEGYALAAGMALGLVTLGRGQTTTGDPGLADFKLEEKLYKYIVGGAQQCRDTNAAGCCLHRGQRFQGFGNAGNGLAVSGSTTEHTTSTSSSSASPGAGRETKHSSDRSGACGGGEHVNIGVTACASALALAFMYMQTNNKAVAAQLAVPDTLILLNNVRPDILLVRTLAMNLIMWNEILPTKEWIDLHEVPSQLRQAYLSIQTREEHTTDLPSHSDVNLICEAHANISAGACMSMGLRFAGTGNVSARATLRSYVLHFRELRTKASSSSARLLRGSSNVVAAATERATVERCLAVCAQALALVDAGTGHVETLTLLRSITLRQRVDAGVSYGNHMALSMAIGLLFLGSGRATISRSKEAIAALVISLYPMPPMNTADNKYHLQALRHLYVLAVDHSRFLETVDVNTKQTCAVQIKVDFLPEAEVQPLHRMLQTPCLLPDITTIQRLAISDPEYYPIEISASPMSDGRTSFEPVRTRTANSLRLEILRNNNVVFLKRRHRKDSDIFTKYTDGNSDNRLRGLFRTYFMSSVDADGECEDNGNDVSSFAMADWGSSWWATQLNSRALKLTQEEPELMMPLILNALHALFRLQQVPRLATALEVVDLRLLSEYCSLCWPILETAFGSKKFEGTQLTNDPEIPESSSSLIEFGVWLTNQTEEALGALWHRSSLHITSLASARVQLLAEAVPLTLLPKQPQDVLDAFLVSVLIRYFSGTSLFLPLVTKHQCVADKTWRAKFQRVLSTCSQVKHQSLTTAQFQLSTFLDQQELTNAEKTFWLKLVTFFLFSN